MGIDAIWKDERGRILGVVDDPDLLCDMCDLLFNQAGSCARFINPAGDACFNQLQLPFLAQELKQILASLPPSAASDHLVRVIELTEKAIGQSHTYVWFVGD